MHERHIEILEAVVDLYVKDAEPVSSRQIAHYFDHSLSPATIRNILSELEELGYLQQPHTSAGRIPTDQGYRFYVNRLRARQLPHSEQRRIVAEYVTGTNKGTARARQLSRVLARRSRALAISGWLNHQEIQEAGLSEIVNQSDEVDVIREISHFIDRLDSYLSDLVDIAPLNATVFIGTENPFFNTKHTSFIIRTIKKPDGDVLLILAGPKRMRYAQNVSLLNSVANIINQQNL